MDRANNITHTNKGAKQVIYYGAKPESITGTRCEALQMVVDTRLVNADSGGVLEQYVEDVTICVKIKNAADAAMCIAALEYW